jgi:hypothetical protein
MKDLDRAMDIDRAVPFTHDGGCEGFITRVGPAVIVSCYGGEQVYSLIGSYLQSQESESIITVWQVDSLIESIHTFEGCPWTFHWELFISKLPESVRPLAAPYQNAFGYGAEG